MVELTREQLEERLAALHRASLDLVQDISLESLLQRIATLACEQAGARYAAVGVLGPTGSLEHFIPIGMSPEEVARMPHPPVGLGLIGALMRSERPIRLANIAADPRSAGFPEQHPPMTSFLGVPIRQGEQTLGQIYLTDKIDAAEFSSDDEQVIEMLAAYAAVAIANARLYKELIQRDRILTRRNENLAQLNQLASTLASSADVEQIIEQALTQVMDYLHLEVGEVFLRQEDGRALKLVLHRGELVARLWDHSQYTIGEGLIGQAARQGQPQLLCIRAGVDHHLHRSVVESGIQQVAITPFSGRRGVVGVLCVATLHPQPLDELELHYLAAISSWVGMAVESVRLNVQGRRLAVLEERERIGMDLHDGIIQSIYAVGLTLEHARLLLSEDTVAARQRIEQATADLNSTIRDIRAYILDLRPRQLNNQNLLQGLNRLVTEFRANTLLDVQFTIPSEADLKLPEAEAVALFHICQEALANVAKHARARRVEISLWMTEERVLLEVHDDGRGFDSGRVRVSLGHGLSNMLTRSRNVGGEVEITSEPGAGTTMLAWVPYERNN